LDHQKSIMLSSISPAIFTDIVGDIMTVHSGSVINFIHVFVCETKLTGSYKTSICLTQGTGWAWDILGGNSHSPDDLRGRKNC
jgi:hypothetical protein